MSKLNPQRVLGRLIGNESDVKKYSQKLLKQVGRLLYNTPDAIYNSDENYFHFLDLIIGCSISNEIVRKEYYINSAFRKKINKEMSKMPVDKEIGSHECSKKEEIEEYLELNYQWRHKDNKIIKSK